MPRLSRRGFLFSGAALAASAEDADSTVDYRALISRADLVYDRPAPRSEEGMPIGNGRMGSLVWTTPTQLRFQINRADVYANNSATNSFFERHNDYCGGCAYFDIDFGPFGAPFPESGFRQRLSVYDGVLTIEGRDLTARIFGWMNGDVLVITIDDRRSAPSARVALRMLRYETKYFGAQLESYVRNHVNVAERGSHTAASRLVAEGERIALTQEFR